MFVKRAFSRNWFLANGSETISLESVFGKNLSPPDSFPVGNACNKRCASCEGLANSLGKIA